MAVTSWASGITGFINTIQGGEKVAKLEAEGSPEYRPSEVYGQELADWEQLAMEGMPEFLRQRRMEDIQRGRSAGLRSSADRRASLAGITGLYQAETDAYRLLGEEDYAAFRENRTGLSLARAGIGEQEQLQYKLNKLDPYLRQYALAYSQLQRGQEQQVQAAEKQHESFKTMGEFMTGNIG